MLLSKLQLAHDSDSAPFRRNRKVWCVWIHYHVRLPALFIMCLPPSFTVIPRYFTSYFVTLVRCNSPLLTTAYGILLLLPYYYHQSTTSPTTTLLHPLTLTLLLLPPPQFTSVHLPAYQADRFSHPDCMAALGFVSALHFEGYFSLTG